MFYTLTKIHKPTFVGRPIISGCSGPTERISAFVDHLIQPIAQQQASYLKDTTDFINFIEKIKLPSSAILVSMDVTSLYTNIPQREGITTVCHAYGEFHQGNPPVPTGFLSEMLSLILQENSFQFNGKDYLQTHGTAMGTKMAVAFANIFMALRLLRTNPSEITFEENIKNFSTRLKNRDYPATTVEKHLSEVNFSDRKKALEQRNKNARKKILPFVTQYHPALPNLKNILMGKWHLIQNHPWLRARC